MSIQCDANMESLILPLVVNKVITAGHLSESYDPLAPTGRICLMNGFCYEYYMFSFIP